MEIDNGRYRLIRRLGQGGTGVVYQAADLAPQERLKRRALAFRGTDPRACLLYTSDAADE